MKRWSGAPGSLVEPGEPPGVIDEAEDGAGEVKVREEGGEGWEVVLASCAHQRSTRRGVERACQEEVGASLLLAALAQPGWVALDAVEVGGKSCKVEAEASKPRALAARERHVVPNESRPGGGLARDEAKSRAARSRPPRRPRRPLRCAEVLPDCKGSDRPCLALSLSFLLFS